MDNNNNIDDAAYSEESNSKNIRGKALYFSTGQVADMLGVPSSTVYYYETQFSDVLNVQIINKQRRFSESDIDKLKYILQLKGEGMTIAQIKEFCKEVDDKLDIESGVVDANRLTSQKIVQLMLDHQQKNFESFVEKLVQYLDERDTELLKNLKDSIELSNNEMSNDISKILNDKVDGINESLNETAEDIKNSSKDMMDDVVSKIETSNDKIKESVDNIKTDTMLNLDRLDKYIYEFNDATETLHKDIEAINNIKSVSMEQIKEYENRGLINKIRNLFK